MGHTVHLTGSSMLKRNLVMVLSGGLLLAASLAVRAQTDPASLPARDAHQGLLVAVNPYVSAEQYKAKFGKHSPYEGGVLAIDVYFRNDNDSPIRVNLQTVRLRIGQPGGSRRRLDPISPRTSLIEHFLRCRRIRGRGGFPSRFRAARQGRIETRTGKPSPPCCVLQRCRATCSLLTAPRTAFSISTSTIAMIGSPTPPSLFGTWSSWSAVKPCFFLKPTWYPQLHNA